MIAFRKAHPTLGRSHFWREDVRWYGVGKAPDLSFESRSLAWFLDGRSELDDDLYVMVNAYWEALTFEIQEGRSDEWHRVIDTSLASPDDVSEPGHEVGVNDLRSSWDLDRWWWLCGPEAAFPRLTDGTLDASDRRPERELDDEAVEPHDGRIGRLTRALKTGAAGPISPRVQIAELRVHRGRVV